MVIAQEPSQPLAALNRPRAANVRIPRKQQDVALPLMIPLNMIMLDIFTQRPPPPKTITLDKHSFFTDLTQRSA